MPAFVDPAGWRRAVHGERYALTPDSAAFLCSASPAYLGGTLEFLLDNWLFHHGLRVENLAIQVRVGGKTYCAGSDIAN